MFPNFLNLTTALLAATAVIPALVILYFLKLRRKEMAVSSTLLWRKAIRDLEVNAPFQKLRRNLLLLLQLLLLLALLLSLARPVMNYTPGAGMRSIFLIDRSASMSATDMPAGKTRLDEAKRRAKDLASTLGRDGAAMVIAFDSSAEIVSPFTGDVRALNAAIDSIQPTDRRTNLEDAYRLADAQAAFTSGDNARNRAPPDVYLFSDGRALDAAKVTVDGFLHYEQIGTDSANNIAVVAMNARRDYQEPTQVQVFARLANFGPDPVTDVQVQISVDGKVKDVRSVNLLPDRYTEEQRKSAIAGGFALKDSIQFATLELPNSAVIQVQQLNTDGDCLPQDDSASVVVPPPKILSVLMVSDGNLPLEAALRTERLKTLSVIVPGQYHAFSAASGGGKALPEPFDVIIFDRVTDLKPDEIPTTGAAVYFGCIPPGLQIKAAMQPTGEQVVCDDNEVLDWERDNPMLAHLNFGKLYAASAIRLLPTLDSKVLIDGSNCPLMVLHRESRAFHLIIPFDITTTNWWYSVTFPTFIYQMLQYFAVGTDMDIRPSYSPGSALRIPRFNLQKISPIPEQITLNGPMGAVKVKVPPNGDFVLPALDKVGVYTTSPAIPQYENIAVSLLDENESNLLPAPTAADSHGHAIPVAAGKSRMELWWWLIAAGAVPLLMLEWWVYTRRVHL